jgi:hypothetical protein
VQYGVCIPDRAATPEVTIVPANEAAWGISRPSWASAAKRSDASASGSRPGAAVGHKEGLRSRRRTRQEAARADRLRAFRGARDERPVAYLDGEAAGGCAVEPRTRLCAPAGWLCASTSSPANQELQDVRAWNAGSLKAAREPLQPRLAVWMSIAATVAACSLAACGGGESEPGAARSTTSTAETGALPPPEQRCRGGKTRPLELETVIEVGRRHGITLHSDPACQPDPTVVSQAANVVLYGPDKNAERDHARRRRGHLLASGKCRPHSGEVRRACSVRRRRRDPFQASQRRLRHLPRAGECRRAGETPAGGDGRTPRASGEERVGPNSPRLGEGPERPNGSAKSAPPVSGRRCQPRLAPERGKRGDPV